MFGFERPMTKLFKRTNPGEALQATQLTLSETETKIRDLQQQPAARRCEQVAGAAQHRPWRDRHRIERISCRAHRRVVGRTARDGPRHAGSPNGGRRVTDAAPAVTSDLLPAELPPEVAGARLAELKKTPEFIERYLSGETKARDEFTRLHTLASKGP